MADLNQLTQALVNADKAGDVDAARVLAQEIVRLRAAPVEQPVKEGDWGEVGRRVDAAEGRLLDLGPNQPETLAAARQQEARHQGEIYGAARGAGETFERSLRNNFSLGLPRLYEAYMPSWAGGQSAMPGADAHEFIKGADTGRAAQNPYSNTAGAVAGTVGQALATGGLGSATTAGGRILQAGLTSAAIGGAEAGVDSRGDLAEMGKGAVRSGLYGLAGGGLVETAAPVISKVGSALAERASKWTGPAIDQAKARILDMAKRGGLDPQSAKAAIARLGSEGTIMDAMGTGGQRMARAAANASPEAQQAIEEALMRRSAGAPDRLSSAAYEAGGAAPGSTVAQMQDDVYRAAQPKMTELYDAARAEGADLPNTPFAGLMQSPMVQGAVKNAEEGTLNRVVAFGEGQNSRLAVFDAAKQNLDAVAEAAARSGDKQTAALASKLAKDLRELVDQHSASYQPARAAARDVYQSQDALAAGAEAARRPSTSTPQLLAPFAGKAEDVARGYGAELADAILSKRGTPGLADAVLGSPNQVNAARSALGPGAQVLEDAANLERIFARTQRGATGNSSTARQLADLGLVPAAAGVGYLGGYDPLQAGGVAALLVAGRRGLNKVLDARRAGNEKAVAQEIASLLLSRGGLPNMPPRAAQGIEKKIADLLISGGRALVAPTSAAIASQGP